MTSRPPVPPDSTPPDAATASADSATRESRWRLLTSAETAEGARATARSLLASLMVGQDVAIGVAQWFRGGTSVEFSLRHEGRRTQVLVELRRMMTRACREHEVLEAPGQPVTFWSGALNIPRAESLEVWLVETSD